MRKINMKDFFSGILIGGLIFGGIGVAAITLTAEQVKYTPSNDKFSVTNAKDALDQLYTMTEEENEGKLTLVGTTTSFNIADIVGAENVGKYSVDDFICVPNFSGLTTKVAYFNNSSGSIGTHISIGNIPDFNLTYDNTTGDVNVKNVNLNCTTTCYVASAQMGSSTLTWSVPAKVYLYVHTA